MPERDVRGGCRGKSAARVTVPEAPSYFDRCTESWQYNVWLPWQATVMEQEAQSCTVQVSSHSSFRLRILATHARHHAASNTAIDDVRHARSDSAVRRQTPLPASLTSDVRTHQVGHGTHDWDGYAVPELLVRLSIRDPNVHLRSPRYVKAHQPCAFAWRQPARRSTRSPNENLTPVLVVTRRQRACDVLRPE